MEQTQAVVEEHYAALRGHDWDHLNSLYAPEVEYEDPEVSVTGDSAVMSRARNLEAPFSDVDLALRSVEAGEDRCTVEWTYQGTNHAPIRTHAGVDFPATGRKITVKGVSVFELQAGRIIRERSYWDTASVYGQLGLLTDPGRPRLLVETTGPGLTDLHDQPDPSSARHVANRPEHHGEKEQIHDARSDVQRHPGA